MAYLFTSESVSEGHPDKVADQISDALIDNFLAFDPESKVACETLVTTGQVILAGEVKSNTYLDVQTIARDVIKKIGYTKSEYMFEANSCGIFSAIHDSLQTFQHLLIALFDISQISTKAIFVHFLLCFLVPQAATIGTDLIGQNNIRKDRALHKLEITFLVHRFSANNIRRH